MVDYIETYEIPGLSPFGVEDQEAPGDHFFPDDYKKGTRKRFSSWKGGCGIGQFDTLKATRQGIIDLAKVRLKEAIEKREEELAELRLSRYELIRYGLSGFRGPD